MKTHKRIEITAFRRRVLLVTGEAATDAGSIDVLFNDPDTQYTVDTGADEGQEILVEAVRLLEEQIRERTRSGDPSPTVDQ